MKLVHGIPNAIDLLVRSEDDGEIPAGPPREGLRAHDVVCHLKLEGALSWTPKELTPANWQATGHGVYVLTLRPEELGDSRTVSLLLTGVPELRPPIIPVQRMFELEHHSARGAIPETILVGRLITLAELGKPKAQVVARVAQFPLLIGGAAITNDAITVDTDDDGYFALKVVTGANIHVNIPAVQYQRQLIVPPPPAPGIPVRLFTL